MASPVTENPGRAEDGPCTVHLVWVFDACLLTYLGGGVACRLERFFRRMGEGEGWGITWNESFVVFSVQDKMVPIVKLGSTMVSFYFFSSLSANPT